jgi:hypothetical protein
MASCTMRDTTDVSKRTVSSRPETLKRQILQTVSKWQYSHAPGMHSILDRAFESIRKLFAVLRMYLS